MYVADVLSRAGRRWRDGVQVLESQQDDAVTSYKASKSRWKGHGRSVDGDEVGDKVSAEKEKGIVQHPGSGGGHNSQEMRGVSMPRGPSGAGAVYYAEEVCLSVMGYVFVVVVDLVTSGYDGGVVGGRIDMLGVDRRIHCHVHGDILGRG